MHKNKSNQIRKQAVAREMRRAEEERTKQAIEKTKQEREKTKQTAMKLVMVAQLAMQSYFAHKNLNRQIQLIKTS